MKINDSSFNFKSTVQDIYDAGFVICDTGYGEITDEEDLPEMEARTVDTVSQYYIGIPTSDTMADYTGVTIQVYNPTSSDCSFKECSIFNYSYEYDPNDEDDKEEFLDPNTNDGYGWTLSTSSASYRYGLNSSTYKTNSLYIEEVYFEKDLDVPY